MEEINVMFKKVFQRSLIIIPVLFILVLAYNYLEPRLPFILDSGRMQSTHNINESQTKGVFVSEYRMLNSPVIRLSDDKTITPIKIWSERNWKLGTMEDPISIRPLGEGINYQLIFDLSNEDYNLLEEFILRTNLKWSNSDGHPWGFSSGDFVLYFESLDNEVETFVFHDRTTKVPVIEFSIIKL